MLFEQYPNNCLHLYVWGPQTSTVSGRLGFVDVCWQHKSGKQPPTLYNGTFVGPFSSFVLQICGFVCLHVLKHLRTCRRREKMMVHRAIF